MMNEQLHRIMDLCLQLENGVTHSAFQIDTNCNMLTVIVWEGEELNEESRLLNEYIWYDGELKEEKKINDIIQALEELLEEQNSWEG